MPPDTPKLISIQTLNQVIFNSGTKPSQFRSLHWHQVNSDLPYWNQVYFDHPQNNQVNFDVNTKTMSFSASDFSVLYTYRYMFLGYSGNTYHMNTTTNSDYYWRFHSVSTGFCVSITWYTIFLFERSEFLIATCEKKKTDSLCVCVCSANRQNTVYLCLSTYMVFENTHAHRNCGQHTRTSQLWPAKRRA